MAIKPEILQQILSDSDSAKPVDGMPHSYAPEEYNKIAAKNRAMGLLNENADYRYRANTGEGAVEFDQNGNLRKIKRNADLLLDTQNYAANRYLVKKEFPKKGEKAKVEILVVFGIPIIKAIVNVQELPPTVKAFRFERVSVKIPLTNEDGTPKMNEDGTAQLIADGYDWEYKGAELIEGKIAYTMTKTLDVESALKLKMKVNKSADYGSDVEGDSLDDIK